MIDDPRGSAQFDPIRVAPRRRRLDPVVIGVFVVIVALGAAIVKPWEAATGGPSTRPSRAVATPTATAAVETARPAFQALADPRTSADTLAAFVTGDGWGIAAISQVGTTASYIDTRTSADLQLDQGRLAQLRALPPVVALAVLSPTGEMPLDARVYQRDQAGRWSWIDARPLSTARADTAVIFLAPPGPAGAPAPWTTGSYRFELRMGTRVERIDVTLADQDGVVASAPAAIVDDGSPPPEAVMVQPLPVGPFVVAGHAAQPLPAAEPLPDQASFDSWLDLPEASHPGLSHRVGRATAAGVTGLGIALPDGSTSIDATVRRLDPDPATLMPSYDVIFESDRSDTPPYLVFGAPSGPTWLPGIYSIDASWTDSSGRVDARWQVELRPTDPLSDPATDPPFLAAARAFARFAGTAGLVVGDPSVVDEAGVPPLRLMPFIPDAGHPHGMSVGCDPASGDGPWPLLGIGRAHGSKALTVTARQSFTGGAETPFPLRTADLDSLTIVAPAHAATFPTGVYQFTLDDGSETPEHVTVCLASGHFLG